MNLYSEFIISYKLMTNVFRESAGSFFTLMVSAGISEMPPGSESIVIRGGKQLWQNQD